MANWLTNLRKKPKHVRDNIAFVVSGTFSLVVCALWFLGGMGSGHLAGSVDGGPHFFQTFLGEFGKQVAAVKETMPKAAPATSTAKSFPESGPAAAATSSWAMATGTTSTPPPQQIMIVTTSSTPTSTPATDL
jgi:hypothetical protein